MCGIAGIIDLTGRRQPDPVVLQEMARSLWHRGPDDDGFLIRQGFGFANRRLSIVGLGDGRQPIFNEDGSASPSSSTASSSTTLSARPRCRPGATSFAPTPTPS